MTPMELRRKLKIFYEYFLNVSETSKRRSKYKDPRGLRENSMATGLHLMHLWM